MPRVLALIQQEVAKLAGKVLGVEARDLRRRFVGAAGPGTAEVAREKATAILGMDIKGHTVHQVMIAQGARIAEEYYFSILLDRANLLTLSAPEMTVGVDVERLLD